MIPEPNGLDQLVLVRPCIAYKGFSFKESSLYCTAGKRATKWKDHKGLFYTIPNEWFTDKEQLPAIVSQIKGTTNDRYSATHPWVTVLQLELLDRR